MNDQKVVNRGDDGVRWIGCVGRRSEEMKVRWVWEL